MMMQGLRRGVTTAIRSRGVNMNMNIMRATTRSMADLAMKEKGDELSYIRRIENERKVLLQSQMTAILDREHSDEEKQALVQLLESSEKKVNPKEVGVLKFLGLEDWAWAFPCAAIVSVPMIMQDVIIIDYKMYLVGVFALMWHTYEATLLPIWSEKSNWVFEYIRDSWIKFDAMAVEELNSDIKTNEEFLQAKEVFQDIFTGIDEVTIAQATSLNLLHKNNFHRAIQKKLDALASLNEATSVAIRNDMISSVKNDSYQVILNDRKVKDAALAQAIAILAAGPTGKRGKDVIGDVYLKSISDYRAGLSNKTHKVHQITAKLEAEIADIVKAPEVLKEAGNVFVTHPILGR